MLSALLLISVATLLFYPIGYFILNKTTDSTILSVIQQDNEKVYDGTAAYIINLDRSKGRYDYIEPQVRKLEFWVERISAIDGSALLEDELKVVTDFESFKKFNGRDPGRGEIGCSLSHIKVWQSFLKSGFEFALVFEDDVNFNSDDLLRVVQELKDHTSLWDMVTFDIKTKKPLTIKALKGKCNLVIELKGFAYAGAYLLTRHAAKKLLEKALPIKMPVDNYFSRSWEFDIKLAAIEPRIVRQSYGDSEIDPVNRNSNKRRGLFISFFEFQYRTMKLCYNLKVYVAIIYMKLFQYLNHNL